MAGYVPPKSSLLWRFFNASFRGHVAVFRLSKGRIGGKVYGAPILPFDRRKTATCTRNELFRNVHSRLLLGGTTRTIYVP